MPARIYNGAGIDDDVAYRDFNEINHLFRRPETPVATNDWDAVLNYGKVWGPAVKAEHERSQTLMYLSGLKRYDATLPPDVTVTELSVEDHPFKLNDPKSWLSDHEVVEKEYDQGWTIRRFFDMDLSPESGKIRHNVALAVGRLVLTGRGKFLFMSERGMTDTDEQYRLDSLLLDPVKVASFKPRKDSDWLDMQHMKYHRDRHLASADTEYIRSVDPVFTRTDYRAAVITPEKIAKGAMEDLTPKMVVAGLRDFLKRYRMIRWSA